MKTITIVENIRLPMCSYGFRSGYAWAKVNGQMQRLHTSKPSSSDYGEHLAEVTEQFKAGKGETP